ncbi:MAG: rsbU [Ignavibacteria bacterium]|nr:MAG: rsbU [Ignavibacteria bacterium]KAF0155894.1 MAG: rsbU [Ignavibacteria bacterium]
MNKNMNHHKYWILASIVSLIALASAFLSSSYQNNTMNTTRPEAIKIAAEFLANREVNTDAFHSEAFIDAFMVQNRYLIKILGDKKYSEYLTHSNFPLRSWDVMFHQNLSKEIPQYSYFVDVSSNGKVIGFRYVLPDTVSLPSLSEDDALVLAKKYLANEQKIDTTKFAYKESKQDNFRNRIDYLIRFDKFIPELNAKIELQVFVKGDQIGGFYSNLEVPQEYKEFFNAGEYLFGTSSAILIVFLMLFAFFLYLKKYHQGEVWMSAARNLFLIYFLITLLSLVNYWPGLGQGLSIGNLAFFNTKLILVLTNGLIVYFFLSLLVFATWSVGESYARSLWPEKLRGIDSFINAHIFSIQSGSALGKGWVLGIGLAFAYVAAAILLNKPNANMFINTSRSLEIFVGFAPAATVVLDSMAAAMITSIATVFFVINISYQRWKRKWISITLSGVVTVFTIVISDTPPSLNNFTVGLVKDFLFGCLLGFLYFRFDLLTIASMLFTCGMITRSFALINSENAFYQFNLIPIAIALLIPALIYVISRFRKEDYILESFDLPSHVKRISERERLRKELEIAAKVQLSLLPKEEPKIPGYDIAAISIPAIEAGGDYFDFVKLSGNKLGVAIGDVSGKGVGAAIYMTLTKGILQAHAEEDASPRNVLAKVNRLLYKTIEKNSFVSMFYAILNINQHKMIYARAGHNPGILTSQQSGGTKLLLSKGMALGLEEGQIFTSTLNEEEFIINQGDVCVLYTDGFTEAMNEKQLLYGEDRLISIIEKNRNAGSRDLINIILKEVNKFVDNYPQHDDMTIVVVKRV